MSSPGKDEHYLAEKFGQAMSKLVTGTESLAERVRQAMVILVMFQPEHMPDQWTRDEFAKLRYLATDEQAAGGEGDLAATLEATSTEHVQGLARTIWEIDSHLTRRHDPRYAADQEPLRDGADD